MPKRSRPLPPPPLEGYMWYFGCLLSIREMERWCQWSMEGMTPDEHWRNDKSYFWAEQRKRSKR